MRWKYKLLEKTGRYYKYAYSRESDDLDGVIMFDTLRNETFMIKPSKNDRDSKWSQDKAREHFWTLVREGFPEYRYVCCG